jgi:hypothetical protein
MFYKFISAEDPNSFEKLLGLLKKLYFPQDDYLSDKNEYVSKLPVWTKDKEPNDERKIIETEKALISIVKMYCNRGHGVYPFIKDKNSPEEMLDLPHIDLFHRFFIQRQWNKPYSNPYESRLNLFNLHPDIENLDINYSKNYRNFNHFVNVVAVLARLIHYFKDWKKLSRMIESKLYDDDEPPDNNKTLRIDYQKVCYSNRPCKRTFILMLAGFYHDIGKTVLDPRHGMEGAILISDQTTTSQLKYRNILQKYDQSLTFSRDDLLFISNLILYHDQYGTLGTGEDGYLRLVDIIDYFKTFTISDKRDRSSQVPCTQRYLFDLWVLNVADILATKIGKFVAQDEYWIDRKKSDQILKKFFKKDPVAHNLIHDLKLTFRLLGTHVYRDNKPKQHLGDTSKIKERAYLLSKDHFIERVRRLITASISRALLPKSEFFRMEILQTEIEKKLLARSWDSTIIRSIQSVSDLQEFCRRFSLIGKMDYSLGFFEKIARRALYLIEREIIDNEVILTFINRPIDLRDEDFDEIRVQMVKDKYGRKVNSVNIVDWIVLSENSLKLIFDKDLDLVNGANTTNYGLIYNDSIFPADNAYIAFGDRTGWIRGRQEKCLDEDYLYEINSQFFIDNFSATTIKILQHLLFREEIMNSQRDIEFVDSNNGLTETKIDKIISHVGPFQANKAIQMTMQTIYLF